MIGDRIWFDECANSIQKENRDKPNAHLDFSLPCSVLIVLVMYPYTERRTGYTFLFA